MDDPHNEIEKYKRLLAEQYELKEDYEKELTLALDDPLKMKICQRRIAQIDKHIAQIRQKIITLEQNSKDQKNIEQNQTLSSEFLVPSIEWITPPNFSPPRDEIEILPDLILNNQLYGQYKQLRVLLEQKKWQAADQETLEVILKVVNRDQWSRQRNSISSEDTKKFPTSELRVINQLWLSCSNKCFGFTIQKEIWLQVGGKINEYNGEIFRRLGNHVGWQKNRKWLAYDDFFTFTSAADARGRLPSLKVQDFGIWQQSVIDFLFHPGI